MWAKEFAVYKGTKLVYRKECEDNIERGPASIRSMLVSCSPAQDIISGQLADIIEAAKKLVESSKDESQEIIDLRKTIKDAERDF